MKKITALIIDDERLARNSLKKKLEKFPEIEVVGEAEGIERSVRAIPELNPDILFLDIQLSDGTGFDLLNRIDYSGRIIFITAYDEFAIRAFEINAVDYLLKPISLRRLQTAIDRIKMNNPIQIHTNPVKLDYGDRLFVQIGHSIHFIKISTIITITASRDYTLVKTSDRQEYLVSKTMTEWEQRLPDQNFCRISRTLIVNFDYIEKSERWFSNTAMVYIAGQKEPLKLSKSYFKKIKDRYI